MDPWSLNTCVKQAQAKGWNGGVMFWEWTSVSTRLSSRVYYLGPVTIKVIQLINRMHRLSWLLYEVRLASREQWRLRSASNLAQSESNVSAGAPESGALFLIAARSAFSSRFALILSHDFYDHLTTIPAPLLPWVFLWFCLFWLNPVLRLSSVPSRSYYPILGLAMASGCYQYRSAYW